MRKANKAKTQSVLSVAIFLDLRRHFYQFSSLRFLYFLYRMAQRNFYDHFGVFQELFFFFFWKKADYIFVLKMKVYFLTSHLPMFVLVWMFCILLPNTQAFYFCDFIPLICCVSYIAQEYGLLETLNTTNWLHERRSIWLVNAMVSSDCGPCVLSLQAFAKFAKFAFVWPDITPCINFKCSLVSILSHLFSVFVK